MRRKLNLLLKLMMYKEIGTYFGMNSELNFFSFTQGIRDVNLKAIVIKIDCIGSFSFLFNIRMII